MDSVWARTESSTTCSGTILLILDDKTELSVSMYGSTLVYPLPVVRLSGSILPREFPFNIR